MGGGLANARGRTDGVGKQQARMAVFGPQHAQCAAGEIGQWHKAILVTLAVPDMDPSPLGIDVADLKGQRLAETQALGLGGQHKDPVAQFAGRTNESLHLPRCQNIR